MADKSEELAVGAPPGPHPAHRLQRGLSGTPPTASDGQHTPLGWMGIPDTLWVVGGGCPTPSPPGALNSRGGRGGAIFLVKTFLRSQKEFFLAGVLWWVGGGVDSPTGPSCAAQLLGNRSLIWSRLEGCASST